ncbi:carboxymuconolactone decarboxylase family protein [Rhodococcus koreensis]|uniref:carboxymuconolactone decarboxylase family protein n=1 Tax=Rhodococcus koreensis TaxID=99653 RepID=UPI00366AFBEF
MHFHDTADRKYAAHLRKGASEMFAAYGELGAAVFAEGTHLPVKVKELCALAVAFTTQCPFCIESHTKAAHDQGATQEEIAEVVMVAAALRAGAAVTHGFQAMKQAAELKANALA